MNKSLLYIEELKNKYLHSNIEDSLINLIINQPHSSRYIWFVNENGKSCHFLDIISNHFELMPIGESNLYPFLDKKYNEKTCKEIFIELTKDRSEPEFVKLKELLCSIV